MTPRPKRGRPPKAKPRKTPMKPVTVQTDPDLIKEIEQAIAEAIELGILERCTVAEFFRRSWTAHMKGM